MQKSSTASIRLYFYLGGMTHARSFASFLPPLIRNIVQDVVVVCVCQEVYYTIIYLMYKKAVSLSFWYSYTLTQRRGLWINSPCVFDSFLPNSLYTTPRGITWHPLRESLFCLPRTASSVCVCVCVYVCLDSRVSRAPLANARISFGFLYRERERERREREREIRKTPNRPAFSRSLLSFSLSLSLYLTFWPSFSFSFSLLCLLCRADFLCINSLIHTGRVQER